MAKKKKSETTAPTLPETGADEALEKADEAVTEPAAPAPASSSETPAAVAEPAPEPVVAAPAPDPNEWLTAPIPATEYEVTEDGMYVVNGSYHRLAKGARVSAPHYNMEAIHSAAKRGMLKLREV